MGYVRLVVSRKRPVRTQSQCSSINDTGHGTFSNSHLSMSGSFAASKPANLLGRFEARALGINTLCPVSKAETAGARS